MKQPAQRHVVIAGPFPPPVHGFSYITQEMAKILATAHDTHSIDLSPHVSRRKIGYHLRRMALTLKGASPLLKGRHFPLRAFYVACEGNLGLVYTLTLCLMARLLGYPIFIHHHSFGYIEAPRRLMAVLLRCAGKDATHIFLCAAMAERFAQRYRTPVRAAILSNSAFVSPAAPPQARLTGRPLMIGLLSNLTEEKGLSLFLDVLRGALAQHMDIAAVLAGPTQSEAERAVIAAAAQEFGTRLDYRGPVYAAAKEEFFRSIDVFVFPTRYVNEAQPTVIFEALAHGIPVLSYDRGCICSQTRHYGAVAGRNETFTPFALKWLGQQLASPEAFARLRLAAYNAFAQDHEEAKQSVAFIFENVPIPLHPANRKE